MPTEKRGQPVWVVNNCEQFDACSLSCFHNLMPKGISQNPTMVITASRDIISDKNSTEVAQDSKLVRLQPTLVATCLELIIIGEAANELDI